MQEVFTKKIVELVETKKVHLTRYVKKISKKVLILNHFI
jgi:hypothetical protein